MSVPESTYEDYPLDLDDIDERLFELYSLWCHDHDLPATIKGYILWVEERY